MLGAGTRLGVKLQELCGNHLAESEINRGATIVAWPLVLRGASAAELPIEQPTKFDFGFNVETAKTLGLTIPAPLLARARSSSNDPKHPLTPTVKTCYTIISLGLPYGDEPCGNGYS
jgi:hypothetical protein